MNRFLLHSLEVACSGAIYPDPGLWALLRRLTRERLSKTERLRALSRLFLRSIPGRRVLLGRIAHRWENAPLDVRESVLIGFGTDASVYLVTTAGRGRVVVKLLRRSLGVTMADALAEANEMRSRGERLSRAFRGSTLVPRSVLLITRGPLVGARAAVQVQEYVEPPHADLLSGRSDAEILCDLSRHPELMQQFGEFYRGVRRLRADGEHCVDLLGEGNVVIAGTERPRIAVLDSYVIQLDAYRDYAPHAYPRLLEALDRLDRLAVASGVAPAESVR